MARNRKPRVISPCGAERASANDHTRIIEFAGHEMDRGGLIEFRNLPDYMLVIPYVLDVKVKVNLKPEHLHLSPNDWAALERQITINRPDSKLARIRQIASAYIVAVDNMSSEELVTYATQQMESIVEILKDIPQK